MPYMPRIELEALDVLPPLGRYPRAAAGDVVEEPIEKEVVCNAGPIGQEFAESHSVTGLKP